MGFMEMSCREPEEVSYGSEEQRRSSLTKRLQIALIISLSDKGPPSFSVWLMLGLCQTSLCLCQQMKWWTEMIDHKDSFGFQGCGNISL